MSNTKHTQEEHTTTVGGKAGLTKLCCCLKRVPLVCAREGTHPPYVSHCRRDQQCQIDPRGEREYTTVSQKIYLQFFEMRRLTSSEHAQSSRDIKCYIISSKVKGDNFRTNSFWVITFLHVCLAKIQSCEMSNKLMSVVKAEIGPLQQYCLYKEPYQCGAQVFYNSNFVP